MLYISSEGKVVGPVLNDNQVCLYVKSKEGKSIKKPYEAIQYQIEIQIREEKFASEKNRLINEIKNKYKVEIDELQPLAESLLNESK